MCIRGRTVLGRMGFPITSGKTHMNFFGRTWQRRCKALRWDQVWRGLGIGLILLNGGACSALSPLGDPKMSDLQLTIDVLNVSLKDAQRTMAELRAEVEAQNQELAEIQVIRAQLEGRVREAEHRLREARQVVGLQREELAESRADRERIARTGVALKSQLKQLRKQLARIERQAAGGVSPTIMELPIEKPLRPVSIGLNEAGSVGDHPEGHRVLSQSDEGMSGEVVVDRDGVLAQPLVPVTQSRVMIKYGDTLWSLAQRYRTSVHQLMAINALSSDDIQAGQHLWLPESVADGSRDERR